MPLRSLRTPDHWLDRAKDAWHHVQHMRDPKAKLQMMEIAESYERMAQRAMAQQETSGNPVYLPPRMDSLPKRPSK